MTSIIGISNITKIRKNQINTKNSTKITLKGMIMNNYWAKMTKIIYRIDKMISILYRKQTDLIKNCYRSIK